MNPIKHKRTELGLTQIEAANSCGVSRRTLQTYENNEQMNEACREILEKLNELGVLDGTNHVVGAKYIKKVFRSLLINKYPTIERAYLYGDYAIGRATGKSPIKILIVLKKKGALNITKVVKELKADLNKDIDLQIFDASSTNQCVVEDVLRSGVRIYG